MGAVTNKLKLEEGASAFEQARFAYSRRRGILLSDQSLPSQHY
jgi:hypothetical protein